MRKIAILGILLLAAVVRAQDPSEDEKKLAARLAALPTDEARQELLQGEHRPITPGLIRGVLLEGNWHVHEGNYSFTLDLYRFALGLATSSGDKLMQSTCLHPLAAVLLAQGNYEEALNLDLRSLALAREAGVGVKGIADRLNLIGSIRQFLGDIPGALQNIREALDTAESAGDKHRASIFRSDLASLYLYLGEYRLALESYERTLSLGPGVNGTAQLLNNIGAVYEAQGNLELALDYYQKCVQLADKINYKGLIAEPLQHIGAVYRRMGKNQLAADYLQQALSLGEAEGNRDVIGQANLELGRVRQVQGNFDEARRHLRASAALYHTMHYPANEALALSQLAAIENTRRDYGQAATHANEALALARQVSDPAALWNASNTAAQANLGLGKRTEARALFLDAIGTIESLRQQIAGGEQDRQRFFEDKLSPYHELLRLSLDDGKSEDALAYAERAKARVLLEELRDGRVVVSKAMTADEKSRERGLTDRLAALNSRLKEENSRQDQNRGRTAQLQERIDALRLEYAAFQSELYARHAELRANRLEEPPATAAEICLLLPDERSAALEYVVTDGATFLFVVTKRAPRLHVYRIPVTRRELERQTLALRNLLAARDLGFHAASQGLGKLLLEPARTVLRGKTTLIMVPDGVLWQLPFQALADGERYLLEDHTISYSPSLTVLREIRKRRQPRGALSVLGMGDPERNLPGADEEITTLRDIYGATRTRLYTGRQATESVFKAEAGNYSILHLATHAVLDDRQPMYSHLLLAEAGNNEAEDGLLEAREMMDLDLKADLVVLSACETAGGRVGAGEGLIGMTWALFVAGASTTVASSWKVDSAGTARLMIEFHRGLKKGLSKAGAMQRAALALMQASDYRHPYYWAGFSVFGNGF